MTDLAPRCDGLCPALDWPVSESGTNYLSMNSGRVGTGWSRTAAIRTRSPHYASKGGSSAGSFCSPATWKPPHSSSGSPRSFDPLNDLKPKLLTVRSFSLCSSSTSPVVVPGDVQEHLTQVQIRLFGKEFLKCLVTRPANASVLRAIPKLSGPREFVL